jgi:hypothetical protein
MSGIAARRRGFRRYFGKIDRHPSSRKNAAIQLGPPERIAIFVPRWRASCAALTTSSSGSGLNLPKVF